MTPTLDYTVDILPRPVSALTGQAGLGQSHAAEVHYPQHFAAFRDPKTVEALKTASPEVKALLSEAGISLECYSSGVPDGYYPQSDEAAQRHLFDCLLEAIDHATEVGSEESAQAMRRILNTLMNARPYGAIVVTESATPISYRLLEAAKAVDITWTLTMLLCAGAGLTFSYLL